MREEVGGKRGEIRCQQNKRKRGVNKGLAFDKR